MYLICHIAWHDHLIVRACEFLGGSSLCYFTMLISHVNISIVMEEIKYF